MLTPKQVAERVGVSDSLVYEWCSQGLLRHFRFGGKGRRGCIRIEQPDLEEFMARCLHTERQDAIPPLKHIKI